MRAPEAAGVIADCLRNGKPAVAVEAVRALATIRDAALGEVLAERLEDGFECPASIVAPALLCCFRETPAKLASLTLAANDALRPLLARILAEVARPGDSCGEAILASDPNPEVRASAARIIAQTRCTGGSGLLDTLAQDQEWFVRLRALIALRVMADRYSIATLMRGLCDSNRLVRLRAAEALARVEGEEIRILELARATCDRYALQALAGEFERCGKLERAITACALGSASARGVLEILVEAGAFRVLAEAARNSPYPIVRSAVDACLHASENPALLEFLVRNGISAGDRKGFHGEDRTDSLVALQTVGTGKAACGDAIGA